MEASLTGLFLGLLLGMRHAIEPDHLAAVSVLATERPGASRGALLGAFWGLGHSLALLVVVVALTVLQVGMPARLSELFELGVALMLVVLGANAVRRSFRDAANGVAIVHEHGGGHHSHPTSARHVHLGRFAIAPRPLLVGLVHGLAGSGALIALVIVEMPTVPARLAYVVLFGLGSVLGMMALSGLAGWRLARITRTPATARAVAALAGACSMGFGIVWGWPLAGELFW